MAYNYTNTDFPNRFRNMEFYYQKLLLHEKKQYKVILEAIRNKKRQVLIDGNLSQKALESIVSAISYDHPELFFVNLRQYSCIKTPVSTTLNIDYLCNTATVGKTRAFDISQKIDQVICACDIKITDSDKLKCRKIHNYLIKNANYNYKALGKPDRFPFAYNAAGVLLEGTAVCEGISKAFKLLADSIGLNVIVVNGMSSLEQVGVNIEHAWNIIEIDDEYYHIDVTWDMNLSQFCKHYRYDYFLVPDSWVGKDHEYSELPMCSEIKESYFYRRRCLFSNKSDLKAYFRNTLDMGVKVLYFKVSSKDNKGVSEEAIVNLLKDQLLKLGRSSYSVAMANNKNQEVYFIRID